MKFNTYIAMVISTGSVRITNLMLQELWNRYLLVIFESSVLKSIDTNLAFEPVPLVVMSVERRSYDD